MFFALEWDKITFLHVNPYMLPKAAAHFGIIAEYNLVSRQNVILVKKSSSDPGDEKEEERIFPELFITFPPPSSFSISKLSWIEWAITLSEWWIVQNNTEDPSYDSSY